MRAVIYARYSTDLQSASSIDDQVRLCRERLAREGHELVKVYSDRAMSGATLIRPGIQLLIQEAGRGDFDLVCAEALDRLSRDQEDAAGFFKRMSFAQVSIITLAEGEISELHVGLKGTMNALFLKDLAQKTRRGLQGRVLQGLSGGGICYGYELVPGETGSRCINASEAKVIRTIYRDFAGGISPRAIAKKLNQKGILGPSGRPWRDTTIRGHFGRGTGILNNELYVGRLVWNRLTYLKDPRADGGDRATIRQRSGSSRRSLRSASLATISGKRSRHVRARFALATAWPKHAQPASGNVGVLATC